MTQGQGMGKDSGKGAEASSAVGKGRRTWFLGWVVVPVFCVTALVVLGVHLGAQGPEAWYTEGVRWVVSRF